MRSNDTGVCGDTGIRWLKRALLLLVAGSLLVGGFLRALEQGLQRVPWDATDSAGRPMGFNDPLGAEHFGIILRAFRPWDLLGGRFLDGAYFLLWAGMHVAFWRVVVRFDPARPRPVLYLMGLQFLLFPVGFLGLVANPFIAMDAARGKLDRESFIDMPFFLVTAHGLWLVVALLGVFVVFLVHRFHAWRTLDARLRALPARNATVSRASSRPDGSRLVDP